MKRILAGLAIMVLFLSIPPITQKTAETSINEGYSPNGPQDPLSLSSASGSGDARTAVKFASRQVTGLTLPITNSYTSTNIHTGALDLSGYLIPGWSLYKAEVVVDSMTAMPERKTMGISPETYIVIMNNTGQITDALYQEFYNQPHDGKLENYTITYICTYYSASLGNAYLGVRSDYSDPSTNVTSWLTPFSVNFVDTEVTHDVSGETAILNAGTSYYVVIDGTGMQGAYIGGWRFNEIYWSATATTLGLETGYSLRGDNWYVYQGIERHEALLNYTYTPWNQTSNAALIYSSPTQISLKGNSTNMQGTSWAFTDPSNITRIDFNTNQSISLDYNLTLWYKQTAAATASWSIPSSGASVDWSVETTLEFPSVTQANQLNISIPSTWSPEGLFNSTHTTNNHTAYSSTGAIVTCSQLYNETWTLKLTSENLMKTLKTYRTYDDIEVTTESMMNSNIDINSTIQQPDANPVTTGSVNLVIWYSGVEFWTPSDKPVASGKVYYLWNISSPKAANGKYRIEAQWSNGSEAGYLSKTLVLYYPSSLTADSYDVHAYTDSTFGISCNFTDLFTPQGLNSSVASLVYSFDGAANQSMTYLNNGIWNATISTAGKTYGLYNVMVYATGYAIENSSLLIHAYLIHDTEMLAIQWSNNNSISFVETTQLSIGYYRVGGVPIPSASVNVTIEGTTWRLPYDSGSETFKITFNGTDSFPGFGFHTMLIDAGLEGYESQWDYSQNLTLYREPTSMTADWSNELNITYLEHTILTISYTMSNGSPVVNAWVNITIDGRTLLLHENNTDGTYYLRFNGSDTTLGFGNFNFSISAWKKGYVSKAIEGQTLTLREVPTLFSATWVGSSTITYVESTILSIEYTMIDGTPVTDASVWVSINETQWLLAWDSFTETYRKVFNGNDSQPGFGIHNLAVNSSKLGHQNHTTSLTLTVEIEITHLNVDLSPNYSINYTDYTILFVDYLMTDNSPISDGYVTVTIGGYEQEVVWNGVRYELRIEGNDSHLVFGLNVLEIQASNYGFASASTSEHNITLSKQPTSILFQWSNGNDPSFYEYTILSVEYTYKGALPVFDATINVTIGAYTWDLAWNSTAGNYQIRFNGSDSNPGVGTHILIIRANKYGFIQWIDANQTLVLPNIPTILTIEWTNGSNITYVETTTLLVKYRMYNNTVISTAYVEIAIGAKNWILNWSDGFQAYELPINGSNNPLGFGTHQIFIDALETDFVPQSSSSNYITLRKEPTSLQLQWWPSNSITYFETTTLSVWYNMSDGTPISDATVNITIGLTTWTLEWSSTQKNYSLRFNGSDVQPGLGNHTLTIEASKYGYATNATTLQLEIRLEDTKIAFEWVPSHNITFLQQTKLRIFYLFNNGTWISNATVNITIASKTWEAVWNITSYAYEYVWHGYDEPLGLHSNQLIIRAWKANYLGIYDTSQTLIINNEPTQIHVSWSNGNNITYTQATKLLVNYTTANSGVAIQDATISVIIGINPYYPMWNYTTKLYEVDFSGSDALPGIGWHNLTVRGVKSGFDLSENSSVTFTIRLEPTTLTTRMSLGTITFVGSTTLSVRYNMSSSGEPILDASVSVTIESDVWILTWNNNSEAYEKTFSGSDSPPGLGFHTLIIQASKGGYQNKSDSLTLTIVGEPTSFDISWSHGSNITYVKGTTLSVRYQMSNASAIPGAKVNVTINDYTWTLTWNSTSEAYERYFAGSDNPPGYGTHIVEINASKFGFETRFNQSQQFTIRLEDTYFTFEWQPSNTTTYVESTKIRIFYRMSNGTPIEGAVVNATGAVTWSANWNSTSQAYEITFLGTDDPPGLGSHQLTVRAGKANYVGLSNDSQIITINEEPTQILARWSNGYSISFTETTTLLVEYTSIHGITLSLASVNVTIGSDPWPLVWNSTSELYEITFSNATSVWPGLGTFGLNISAKQFGYKTAINISQTLAINSEQVKISSALVGGSTITYIGSTVLVVNYTTTEGVAVVGATINVTIEGNFWNLTWDSGSETYRIRFNGSDSLPGFGNHHLEINASCLGFEALRDTSKYLKIIEEPTSLNIFWGAPNFNNVTYFDYTFLYVEYKMSSNTTIQDAVVNVTIGTTTWTLNWNSTQMAYSLRFNGSDVPPGLGTHGLTIEAEKYGYVNRVNNTVTLILSKDPTTIEVSWINGHDISYVETSTLSVVYKMSNGSDILGALVIATIESNVWNLTWNGAAGAYQAQFTGDQNPPGLGSFLVTIQASADVFVAQVDYTSLTIHTESTTATPSWSAISIDWTQSIIFSVDFRDSYGSPIYGATTKSIYVNGTKYELLGTNGTYWMKFNNTFDLGSHSVSANISKFGYQSASVFSISFNITEAPTALNVLWSSVTIDYLGQSDLTLDYYYTGTGISVPSAGVIANITIDGTKTIRLTLQAGYWIANLTGISLDLGVHDVVIQAWVYGYEFSQTSDSLTVNEVLTNPLLVGWNPTNLTIEYTDYFGLTVDYTYDAIDVPGLAMVNVTVDGRLYTLVYSGGLWSTSIPGAELGIGHHTATVSAWLYGYALQTAVTSNLNVTVAANSFLVTWEPWDLDASYIDTVNVTVVYTQDFIPIFDATVQLMINNTPYLMTYIAADEMWSFSMRASVIGLGTWNVTVTANKTGYADGRDSRILTISPASSSLVVLKSALSIYYDEDVTFDVYYQLLNTSVIPGATLTFEVDGTEISATWEIDHWTYTDTGESLGVGVHSVYIFVAASGFEAATQSFDVTVNAIPTSVTTPSTTISMFAHESITISFTWLDEKNSAAIPGYTPEVIWPDSFSVVDLGNGNYSIQLNSAGLHVGNYELQANFVRSGYENGTCMISIEVLELPIVLLYDDTIVQYENESITIDIEMLDGPHAAAVDWGEITLELDGVQHTLVYDSESELYSVEIWLSNLSPGNYSLNFTASASDCETDSGTIQLEIMPKTTYELTLEVSEEVKTGQQIQITVLATCESNGVSGLSITVHIVIERRNKAPQVLTDEVTTMSEGLATLEITVPNDATSLTIWAEFEGSISQWPANSDTVYRETSPGGFDILAFIFSLFSNPVTLIITLGIIGGPLVGVLFYRRRRGIPASSGASAMESAITQPTSTPAPASELDLIQDLIKSSPAGLTRAQIAQSLEISNSKASALLKKLLDSNTGFEEIREGRLRRVIFKE